MIVYYDAALRTMLLTYPLTEWQNWAWQHITSWNPMSVFLPGCLVM